MFTSLIIILLYLVVFRARALPQESYIAPPHQDGERVWGPATSTIQFAGRRDTSLQIPPFGKFWDARIELTDGWKSGAVWNLQAGNTYVRLRGTVYCLAAGLVYHIGFHPQRGMPVSIYPCPTSAPDEPMDANPSTGVEWVYDRAKLRLKDTNLCLDLAGGHAGTHLQIYDCSDYSAYQSWITYPHVLS